jgi:alpha-L-glutamate ligase-like protein
MLSGLFSLGGQPDHMLIEYCVQFDPIFDHVSYKGVPDVRIISVPRLPGDGHDPPADAAVGRQGQPASGRDRRRHRHPDRQTKRGVWNSEIIREHPDTEHSIVGLQIPRWDELLHMIGAKAYELCELGYVGVDVVLDKQLGPLVLELNARPGLAIQIANGNGLLHRLRKVQELERSGQLSRDPAERVAFAKAHFPTT